MTYYNGANGYYNPQPQFMMQQNPMIYPQQQQQYVMPPQPIQNEQTYNDGLIWVQGRESAKAYPIAPNRTLILWDSDEPFIYKKTADKNGKPIEFKVFKLIEETEGQTSTASVPKVEYATKEDVSKINAELDRINDTLLDIQTTPDLPPKRTRRAN